MDIDNLAKELLTAYGQLTGLPTLKFEPHGCARLLFEGSIAVDLEIDRTGRCLQMYNVLGPVPTGNLETLYRRLLESNLFGTHTRGATLSIDAAKEEVLIGRRIDLESTNAAVFAELLQEFSGVAQQWHHKFGSGELMAAASGGATQDSQVGMYLRA